MLRFSITIHDGAVQPPAHTEKVAVGDTVRIRVVDDHADELHIHPTVIAKPIKAGQPLTVTLHVNQAMTYYVEEHRSATPLLQLNAQ